MMNQVDKVLEERSDKYGSFHTLAEMSQEIKAMYYKNTSNIETEAMNEAMEMIIHKLVRIFNGDPMYKDNLIDIQGYCQLYLDELDRIESKEADEILK
jgi:glucan phosphorylase